MHDAGAHGIIVPMIQSPDEARQLVESCLYPPLGRRSFGPVRVGTRDGPGYAKNANDQVAVIPMIETAEALENVEEIVSIPGVDAAFVGPFDLSVALGLPPRDNDGDPKFDAAITKVVDACKRHGTAVAVLSNVEVAPLRVKQGFQMVSVTTDIATLTMASATCLATVKKKIAEEAE